MNIEKKKFYVMLELENYARLKNVLCKQVINIKNKGLHIMRTKNQKELSNQRTIKKLWMKCSVSVFLAVCMFLSCFLLSGCEEKKEEGTDSVTIAVSTIGPTHSWAEGVLYYAE